MEDRTEFDEWALEAASQVVAHVERNGMSITWSEAHWRVLVGAHRADHGVLVENDHGGVEHPITNPLGWRHPDFIEAVAAIHCQWVGHPYHPTRPDSEVPVGISTHTRLKPTSGSRSCCSCAWSIRC
jgi:hypothetical protein